MKLRDKTMAVLESALAEIQRREFVNRKNHEFQFADGLHSAWQVLTDVYSEYVEQKSKKNPIWRWRVQLGYKKASKAIRVTKL